jgi:hypothetical protein
LDIAVYDNNFGVFRLDIVREISLSSAIAVHRCVVVVGK